MKKSLKSFKHNLLISVLFLLTLIMQTLSTIVSIHAATLGYVHKLTGAVNVKSKTGTTYHYETKWEEDINRKKKKNESKDNNIIIGNRSTNGDINTEVGNDELHIIYYLVSNIDKPSVAKELAEIMDRVLKNPDKIGQGIKYEKPDHTQFFPFFSGASDAELSNHLKSYNDDIKNAYSKIKLGDQGKFNIESATHLFHTEPKALDVLLSKILPANEGISDVILVSEKPMCPCCSRLLLSILNELRNQITAPNIIIISKGYFNKYLNDSNNMTPENKNKIREKLAPENSGSGNLLTLSIHYSSTTSTTTTSTAATSATPVTTTSTTTTSTAATSAMPVTTTSTTTPSATPATIPSTAPKTNQEKKKKFNPKKQKTQNLPPP